MLERHVVIEIGHVPESSTSSEYYIFSLELPFAQLRIFLLVDELIRLKFEPLVCDI